MPDTHMRRSTDKSMTMFRTIIMFVIVFVVGAFVFVKLGEKDPADDPRTALAQCLTESGTTMYGAYWCPHCARQKKSFGKAFAYVDYVECAVPGNPQATTQDCIDAEIKGYPTWEFPDGSRQSGEVQLEVLAEKSGCAYGDDDTLSTGDATEDPYAEVITPDDIERMPSSMDGTEEGLEIDEAADVISQPY